MLSSPTYDVKVVKGMDMTTHSSSSINDPSSKKGNTLSSPSIAAQSSNPSTSSCIAYDLTTNQLLSPAQTQQDSQMSIMPYMIIAS
jgi:hypothetical protein